MDASIPNDWRARCPRMGEAAWAGLRALLEHRDAPRWNWTIGDRVDDAIAEAVERFRARVKSAPLESSATPSEAICAAVRELGRRTFHMEEVLANGLDPSRHWSDIPTLDREDLMRRMVDLVPRDAPLEEAVLYDTSGTTGHPIEVLHHPRAVAMNHVFAELVFAAHGVFPRFEPGRLSAINMCAQRRTFVFATCFTIWNQSTFAKINLAEHDWAGGIASADRFLRDHDVDLVTADPITMAEMVRLRVPVRPRVMMSGALTLEPGHRARVEAFYGCPVADVYGATEVGPIAATVPVADGHVVLFPDLYVEAVDREGLPVPDGEEGEITVTGGRNPYLPLVRYRTGDRGRLGTHTLPDGRRARIIRGLGGRDTVMFRNTRGGPVNSIDISRSLREVGPFAQHAFVQRRDGSVELLLRPSPGLPIDHGAMKRVLQDLFGRDAEIRVAEDECLGEDGKPRTWVSELEEL